MATEGVGRVDSAGQERNRYLACGISPTTSCSVRKGVRLGSGQPDSDKRGRAWSHILFHAVGEYAAGAVLDSVLADSAELTGCCATALLNRIGRK